MPSLLKTMDAERLQLLVLHPAQLRLADTITALLADLRTCTTPEDYYGFQGTLFHELHDVETRRAQVSRVVKRLRRGESIPMDAPALDDLPVDDIADRWRIENDVLERLARQLRTVGDALAWRASGYDRRYVVALSQNPPAGPIAGKAGLPSELGAVVEKWEKNGHFALLHDVTSCLRIGDITEFADDTRVLWEIKASPGRTRTDQVERMKAAIDTVNDNTPLPNGEQLVHVDTPLRTHLSMLADAIRLARERGVATMRVPGGRALLALAPLDAFRLGGDGVEWSRRTDAARTTLLRRAKIAGATHHFIMRTGDRAARSPASAPYGVYPMDPAFCAGLICDLIHVEVTFDPDALATAAEGHGFRSEVLLPPTHGDLLPEDRVLRLSRGHQSLVMHPAFVDQLLAEFLTLDCAAAGVTELFARETSSRSPILLFADQAAVWR